MKLCSAIIIIISILTACSDTTINNTAVNTNKEYHGSIGVSYKFDTNQHKSLYDIEAQFYHSFYDTTLIDVGRLNICDCEFLYGSKPDVILPVGVYGVSGLDSIQLGYSLTGKICQFSIDGNAKEGIPGFAKNFYLPRPIYSFRPFNNSEVSLKDGFLIEWEPDKENPDSLIIDISIQNNTSLFFPNVKTKETGKYNVKLDAAVYHIGDVININLFRRNIKEIIVNGLTFRLSGYTYTDSHQCRVIE